MKLTIDSELKNYLEPLTATEYQTLTENIKHDGCREPLVVWNGTLIDGHNRYEICTANNITFTTSSIQFESRNDAKIWMIKNQFGKRNWTTYTASTKALLLEDLIAEKAKANQKLGPNNGLAKLPNGKSINTRVEIAKIAGVGDRTIGKVKYINAHADDAIKEKLRKNETTVEKVYKTIRNDEYKQSEAIKKDVSTITITSDDVKLYNCDILAAPIADNSLDVIATDPPYPREFLDCWKKLAEFAVRKLKPNGVLIAMSGQSYLPYVYKNMSIEGLNYYWTGCIYTPGQSAELYNKRLRTHWKPLLLYCKGIYQGTFQSTDVYEGKYADTKASQERHKWGQSLPIFDRLVKDYTYKDSIICDPFMGGGTTALAAIANKRKFVGVELDKEVFAATSKHIQEAL